MALFGDRQPLLRYHRHRGRHRVQMEEQNHGSHRGYGGGTCCILLDPVSVHGGSL